MKRQGEQNLRAALGGSAPSNGALQVISTIAHVAFALSGILGVAGLAIVADFDAERLLVGVQSDFEPCCLGMLQGVGNRFPEEAKQVEQQGFADGGRVRFQVLPPFQFQSGEIQALTGFGFNLGQRLFQVAGGGTRASNDVSEILQYGTKLISERGRRRGIDQVQQAGADVVVKISEQRFLRGFGSLCRALALLFEVGLRGG